MNKRIDLTTGKITEKLLKLALPIMATSFIQMAYNLIDMLWVGKVGSNAVASVGTAGFFTWLAMAFITISKVGAEVKVAQSIGEHNIEETKTYIKSAIEINLILSIIYTIFLLLFKFYSFKLYSISIFYYHTIYSNLSIFSIYRYMPIFRVAIT